MKLKFKIKSIITTTKLFSPYILLFAVVFCIILISTFNKVNKYTSSNDYCMSCHVHSESDNMWRFSTHYNNTTGNVVNCVDCHLPPKENGLLNYTFAKAKHGAKDVYGYLTKDTSDFNWELKSHPDMAEKFVYDEGCVKCHQNLFPSTLNSAGCEAHLYFEANAEEKSCISCHISVGHYNPLAHGPNYQLADISEKEPYIEAFQPKDFSNFTEQVPGSPISFNMVAIPGGKFIIGSTQKDEYARADEFPAREVQLSDFWMGEVEVSWDEFLTFFAKTASQGRKENVVSNVEVDGITGPTPPWGAPDQGWGKGSKPAITMTHHAATVYCQWLSRVTGKNYRLPTEAEWEYAARGGTSGPYFFEGTVKQYRNKGLIDKVFGPDTSVINSYVVYHENSPYMTQAPFRSKPNPFGLKNMIGNVAEFCLDYYDPKIYAKYPKGIIVNPFGPRSGTEHVIRGGAYLNQSPELRISRRDFTQTKNWLKTDPQIPKSIWWYSDSKHVGFRVVCTVNNEMFETK